jgi:hypothetical protein
LQPVNQSKKFKEFTRDLSTKRKKEAKKEKTYRQLDNSTIVKDNIRVKVNPAEVDALIIELMEMGLYSMPYHNWYCRLAYDLGANRIRQLALLSRSAREPIRVFSVKLKYEHKKFLLMSGANIAKQSEA